jgi:hypothetical protein
MKIFTKLLFLIVALCCWGIVGHGQVTIAADGYEAGGSTWVKTITPATYEVGSDIWAAVSSLSSFSSQEGSLFWGMQDLNNSNGGGGFYHVLEYEAIDISSYNSVVLTFKYFTVGYDGSDNINYEVRYDNGSTWSAGTALSKNTGAWTTVTINVPAASNFVRLRLRADQDGGSDYAGFDDIKLTGIATSTDPEPTNHPTTFISDTGAPPTSVIEMVWDDATGAQLPAGYVIKANTTGTFSDPVDGTDPTEDTDLSDGTALVKVAQGTEFYSFSGLNASTQYYFKIWPYTNAGANIDFKTDETPLEDNTTTEAECGITNLGSASISCDSNTSGDDNDFVTISLDYTGVDAGAVLAIVAGGSSESNTGDDPTSVSDGTISFSAEEGDTWSVTITGGNCDLSESGSVLSSECDPPPAIVINELLADPDSDVNGDGVQDAEDDEFVEIYNSGGIAIDISGWRIEDAVGTRHTFPASTIVQPDEGIVVFGGGGPTGIPSLVQTASTGALGINNSGDNIKLYDNSSTLIDSYSFGSSTNDVSYARSPDYSGSFVLHTAIAGNPVNYSPGRFNIDNVPFPVEITFLTGNVIGKTVTTSWQTATEENNSHFLIQRSTDEGKTFETIGQVEGKGDSNSAVDYKFVDTKPAAGMNYYRLQQFDFDGTNEFFGPVAVRFGGEVADAPVIWPVPARDRLQIQLPASDSDWQLEVYDLNGRRLLQKTTEEKGINTFFDLNTLPAGSYFLRWSNGSQSGQERFLKV